MKALAKAVVLGICAIDDCGRREYKAGLCAGHHARKLGRRRGSFERPLQLQHAARGPERLSTLDLLCAAARAYSDADPADNAEWERRRRNLANAARVHVLRPRR